MEFVEHTVEWSDEKVARFWDHFNRKGTLEYFAEQVGDAVIAMAATQAGVTGAVLDFGCGKGALIGKLLGRGGVRVTGCDFSPASVEYVKARYRGVPGFQDCHLIAGLPSSLPGEQFDRIFLLETVEHLIDPHLEGTVTELGRLLKPGGSVIVTTPNLENLGESQVMCPDCGAVFHRVQHVRSFDRASIRDVFARGGFEEVFCRPVHLGPRTHRVIAGIAAVVKRALGRTPLPAPNLVFIGRKP